MAEALVFEGFIKDVQYQAHLTSDLSVCSLSEFDVNKAKPFGIIDFKDGQIAYSKWTSPKRTRTYPFARLYNTYNSPKIITIIPVLKDEGLDGDLDRIQYSTISWMNLLNVYIVLAYYEDAVKNHSVSQASRNKLTRQRLNASSVIDQINEILIYKQSALHWNRSLFESHFADIYEKSVDAYEKISAHTGVTVHSRKIKMSYLNVVRQDYQKFKDISLKGSRGAALRESKTIHLREYLQDGGKCIFFIENYLGGTYHLTADEVLRDKNRYIIQESKNSEKNFLPSTSDIKDGLFKLILFANLHSLKRRGKEIKFSTRLKLTGYQVKGKIQFPCTETEFTKFVNENKGIYTKGQLTTLVKLKQEAAQNHNLTIEIGPNNG